MVDFIKINNNREKFGWTEHHFFHAVHHNAQWCFGLGDGLQWKCMKCTGGLTIPGQCSLIMMATGRPSLAMIRGQRTALETQQEKRGCAAVFAEWALKRWQEGVGGHARCMFGLIQSSPTPSHCLFTTHLPNTTSSLL